MLATARSPILRLAAEIAVSHHERWDGNGYLAGLAGEDIPVSGRITSVADVFDALTHERPYKAAWERERALEEITSQAGRQLTRPSPKRCWSWTSTPWTRAPPAFTASRGCPGVGGVGGPGEALGASANVKDG